MHLRRLACAFLCLSALASTAHAQSTRTWVSGVGDDANPCSRTAPCKTFAGAISKTATGGEINVLDPGGFGGITINKSISIIADHVEGGVLVAGTNAIVVNADPAAQVVLRGLDIEGLGSGINGILFLAGAALIVEDCTINAFTGKGISFTPAGNANLTVRNTTISRNTNASAGGGILVAPSGSAVAFATLDHVRLTGNQTGLQASDRAHVMAINSDIVHSLGNGVLAQAAAPLAEIDVRDSTIAANGLNGVKAGANGTIRLSNVYITNNTQGINVAGGNVVTFGNVQNSGNGVDGTPNLSPIPMQ